MSQEATLNSARIAAMIENLGEPERVDRASPEDDAIDIYVFERNFIEECDGDVPDNDGYVLVTSGMSDRLMPDMRQLDEYDSPALELIWYVRDLRPEYLVRLRWLAQLPQLDHTAFGFGHTVSMPEPPLSFCQFKTFFLLQSIYGPDRRLFSHIKKDGHAIATLTVNLISDAERQLVQNVADGLDEFLDMLDENEYPMIFDPVRPSYL